MENNENKNQPPKHLKIFKVLGILFIVVAVAGIVLSITGFGNFENKSFMIGGFMTTFGLFLGATFTMFGFKPEMTKLSTRTARYIQEQNKEDFTQMASNTADITSDAVTRTTRAVKKGLKEQMYCKHCGAEIDRDSKFCKECGEEQ